MVLSKEDAKDARSHKDANIRNANIDDSYSLTKSSNLIVVLCQIKGIHYCKYYICIKSSYKIMYI